MTAFALALVCAAFGEEPAFTVSSSDGVLRAGIDVVVPRSASELWPPLSGTGAQHEWVPYMRTASVARSDGDTLVCAGVTNLPWPFRDRTWEVRMTARMTREGDNPLYIASWEYVPGSGTLEDTMGSWSLEQLPDGRTHVRLQAMADIGKSVPGPLLGWARNRALPAMLEALVDQADRGAP